MRPIQTVVSTGLVLAALAIPVALAALERPSDQSRKPSGAKADPASPAKAGPFALRSRGFGDGSSMPARYSCDGLNLSPELSWSGAPAKTQSFVLIVDDPDAPGGTFVHWVFFDIGGKLNGLPEGQPAVKLGVAGINDFGKIAYGGPCPPKGRGVHRYFFKLHALDVASLGLRPGATLPQVDKAMAGHILGTAQLIGRFGR